jgi:hypothetical protein
VCFAGTFGAVVEPSAYYEGKKRVLQCRDDGASSRTVFLELGSEEVDDRAYAILGAPVALDVHDIRQ